MNLAIVTPWFGVDPAGGAERLAFELARGLQERGHAMTVLTTCARSFTDPWNKDAFAAGEQTVSGIRTRRFRVDRTNAHRFLGVNAKLLSIASDRLKPGAPVLNVDELQAFVNDNIGSTDLCTFLASEGTTYDALLFLPYLYGTTLRGWRIVRDRAVIVPCLHNEAYAYLPPVADAMRGAAALIFNTEGEQEVARELYGPSILARSRVLGTGTAPVLEVTAGERNAIDGFIPEEQRYVLFLGRIAREKNLDLLLDAYRRFKTLDASSSLKLVLAGEPSAYSLDAVDGAINLGFVNEMQKSRLLRHARALVQPSINESFSRVMFEAWSVGKPVGVHAGCKATAMTLARTGAGWQAKDAEEWRVLLHTIDAASDESLAEIGARAGSLVRNEATWAAVLDRYDRALREIVAARVVQPAFATAVVHELPAVSYGSGLTNLALGVDATLRRAGYNTMVTAATIDPRLSGLVRAHVTGESQALRLVYNDASVPVPAFVDLETWNIEPDPTLMAALQDGRTNVLAVAPVCAQGGQLDILDVFGHYLTLDFEARLILVGDLRDGAYAERVRERIARTHLEHRLLLTGQVSLPALAAFYRTAHLAVDFRERHVTGLALLEAMAFDVPICATSSADTRAVLGTAGVIAARDMPPLTRAGLWRVLIADVETRAQVIATQRKRFARTTAQSALDAVNALAAQAGVAHG